MTSTEAFSYFTTLLWNIEGIKRNLFNLYHFTRLETPDFIFLAEPQIFHSDLPLVLKYFSKDYCLELNSEDCFDPELPLTKNRSFGGTMALWKQEHDPFVTVLKTTSSAILPIIFSPKGSVPSAHITIYLILLFLSEVMLMLTQKTLNEHLFSIISV